MSALTRILNNQIFNSTIIASQKIAAGTITGSLFASNVTVPGDLLISGNLFVLGTSAYTTIASTNTYVNDPLVVLNNGFAGTNTYDEGVVFNRGSLLNQAFIWSEFNKEFRLVGTTETGTTYGNVAVSNFANLHIGNLTVDYAVTHNGNFFSNGFINTTGNISGAVGVFGAINSTGLINTTGNVSASQVSVATLNATGLINTLSNISASQGSFATLNATGLINTTGNVSAATINAATVNTSGNVLAAVFNGGALNVSGNVAASTVLAQLVTADDATFGNVVAGFVGNTGTAFTGASLNLTGNASASTINAATINTSGNVLATVFNGGAVNVSGNVVAATVLADLLTANDLTVGNVAAGFIGNTGTAFTGASINLTGNVVAATVLAQLVTADDATFGNVVAGFVGNTGTAFTGATINLSGNVLGGLAQFAAINSTPIGNASASTGAFTTLSAANNFYANASIATTAQGIGAVVVPNGGISVSGAANIAGAITTAGAAQFNNTVTVGGITTFTNSTNATSITDGAVKIQGGASVLKDLYVGGNLYAANIVGITANVITVEDPLLFLKPSYTFPYNYDIGIYSSFQGAGLTTAGNVLQHTGVVRHQETNTWTFASNLAEPGAGHVVFDNNTVYDPIKAGNLELVNTTAATTTGTGALIVAGGAGIGGSLYARDIQATVIGNTTAAAGTFTTVTAGQVSSGFIGNTGTAFTGASINLSGNVNASTVLAQLVTADDATFGNVNAGFVGNTGTVFTGATINLSGNVLATGGIFNALTVNGNETITGYLNVAGNILATRIDTTVVAATGIIWANSTTASTNTTTGALVLAGGLGLAGNIFQGGAYHDTSATNALVFNTPTTVDAFKSATDLEIGATSGTFTINNPTVVGTQSTQALYNTAATTMNFAGAATTLVAGATSGVAHLRNANIWLPNATTLDGAQTDVTLFSQGATNANIFLNANVTIGGNVGTTAIKNQTLLLGASNIWLPYTSALNFANSGVTSISIGGDAFAITFGNLTGFGRFRSTLVADGVIYGNSTSAASSTTTGALVLAGGAGIGGKVFVANGAVFNNSNTTDTFQIKSSTSGNVALFANLSAGPGTSESVIIGGANTVVQSGVTLKVNSTTSMMMPIGPTSARPSSIFGAGYDVAGMIRFNSTINNMEFYDGSVWQVTGSTFTVISDRQFSGNVVGGFGNVDGTNTNFTLQANSTTAGTIVSINGVMQFPTLAYSITGATMTFTEPPAPGDVIDARIITTTTTVSTLASGNGLNQFIAADTGAQIWTGTSSTVERIEVDTSGNFNFLTGNKVTYDQTVVSVPNTNLTLLDSFSANSYTTSKYVISMKQGTGNVQAMEALLTQSTVGSTAGTAYVTTYGIVNTGNTMGTLAANVDISGSWTVKLWLIPNNGTAISNVKVMTTYIV